MTVQSLHDPVLEFLETQNRHKISWNMYLFGTIFGLFLRIASEIKTYKQVHAIRMIFQFKSTLKMYTI